MLTNEDLDKIHEIIRIVEEHPEKARSVAQAFASVGVTVNDFKRLDRFIKKGKNNAN